MTIEALVSVAAQDLLSFFDPIRPCVEVQLVPSVLQLDLIVVSRLQFDSGECHEVSGLLAVGDRPPFRLVGLMSVLYMLNPDQPLEAYLKVFEGKMRLLCETDIVLISARLMEPDDHGS